MKTIPNFILSIIGAITVAVLLVFFIVWLLGIVEDKLDYIRYSKKRVAKNARKQRKKYILNQIENWLQKDIEYYDFDSNSYEFRAINGNTWIPKGMQFVGDKKDEGGGNGDAEQ